MCINSAEKLVWLHFHNIEYFISLEQLGRQICMRFDFVTNTKMILWSHGKMILFVFILCSYLYTLKDFTVEIKNDWTDVNISFQCAVHCCLSL